MTEAGKTLWASSYSLVNFEEKILDSTFKLGDMKFIDIMPHYGLFTWKGKCLKSFTDVFVAIAINIHNKILFNIECFKKFLRFSSIPFIISKAQLEEAGY